MCYPSGLELEFNWEPGSTQRPLDHKDFLLSPMEHRHIHEAFIRKEEEPFRQHCRCCCYSPIPAYTNDSLILVRSEGRRVGRGA